MASELPKRLLRPGREPRVRQINNKCTMATLTKLEEHLPNELNQIKRDPVFGPILKIPDNGLLYSARLIHSFLCRQLATDKKQEMWFVFARRPLRFSLQEFHAVSGLKVVSNEDEDVDLESWIDDGGVWSRLLRRDENISLDKIWKEYITVANTWMREDRLRLAYICVIAGLVMAIGDTATIPREWIILAMDMRKIHSYRWGVEAYDILLKSLTKVRHKYLTAEESKRKDTYVLEGFSYAFQIWIMEAIPVLGMLVGKKLTDRSDGPRCSNWTGCGRVSYEQIDQLEKSFDPEDKIYPFISITGYADVVQDADCVYAKENADARVDQMTLLCRREHDWTGHVWEVEVISGSSSPVNESPSEEPNEEEQNASVSTPATRKRKIPDHGAEERKRRLLFERSAPKQSQCNEEIIESLKEMFETSFSSWEARLWTKIVGRMSNMEHEITQIKDSINALAATTTTHETVTPSDPRSVDTAKPKRVVSPKGKGKKNNINHVLKC